MPQSDFLPRPARTRPLTVRLAHHADQVKAAQALRYQVFAEELGARLDSRTPGLDIDLFDAYCDHLLVCDEESEQVVGTYRILPPAQAQRLGSYYSDAEFDLIRLQSIRPYLVELGRSCVHPDYRTGAAIALLWGGLADYMSRYRHRYLIGCASIGMGDGGYQAVSVARQLLQRGLAPVEWRVQPRQPLPNTAFSAQGGDAAIPPLIKGYLRAGAYLCGEPAWDERFNSADLLLLLPMERIDRRYARHFFKSV
ncbi:GNAT family N-acetyltransferase [Chitinimonas lacunae]|uniref:L-ornithine N(alpha)-acyltransferase n=1 Tax=Chitinimonas lacunae TaxID=1963018 RepID=A0ABV8MPZ7_9NEIS